MSKQPPPAPTASAAGPCPTVIQIVRRPGTGSLPSTIASPDHPLWHRDPISNGLAGKAFQSLVGLLEILGNLFLFNKYFNKKNAKNIGMYPCTFNYSGILFLKMLKITQLRNFATAQTLPGLRINDLHR